MKIKKGDTVKIITGKDKDKTGKVLKVLYKKNKVLIEGLNIYKKNVRPKREGEKGQTILLSQPVDVSNALLVCPACGKAVRIGYRLDGERKIRVCKKCGATIS